MSCFDMAEFIHTICVWGDIILGLLGSCSYYCLHDPLEMVCLDLDC